MQINYVYDPKEKIVTFGDKVINFYCGDALTDAAVSILNLYFGFLTPQQALVDKMLERSDLLERMFNND